MSDLEREAFEAWFRDEGTECCGIDSEEQLTWRAFQAALAWQAERAR